MKSPFRITKTCDNCCFSTFATGTGRPVLLCRQLYAIEQRWRIRPLDASCQDFYPKTSLFANTEKPYPRRIPLTRNQFAILDAHKYPQYAAFQWFAESAHNTFYAVRKENGKSIKMHRALLNAPPGLVVDHIDHNGLNNQISNLRLCTFEQNTRNRKNLRHKTSIYKGVHYHKGQKKFTAAVTYNKKTHHLGYFTNEVDAAEAYDKMAAELFKEFAYLNFPEA